MRKSKTSMKCGVFYVLYKARKINPEEYIPIWKLIGEVYVEELNEYVFLSYKAVARMSDLYIENPNLFEREWITGKSGSRYYGYRFAKNADQSLIKDSIVLDFYTLLKRKQKLLPL